MSINSLSKNMSPVSSWAFFLLRLSRSGGYHYEQIKQAFMYIKGIKVKNIDWCVEEEDIMDYYEWWSRIDEVSDEEMNAALDSVLSELPKEDYIPVESDRISVIGEKIDDIADWLSEKHGWLVNGVEYTLIDGDGKERQIEFV